MTPVLAKSSPGPSQMRIVVFFAVEAEARPFRRTAAGFDSIETVVSGMGEKRAQAAVDAGLRESPKPELILTCGFAGGLNPGIGHGEVVFDADPGFPLTDRLRQAGAIPGTFQHSKIVLATTAAKQRAHTETRADAVDMESRIIRDAARRAGVPSATVRVISDASGEDLPLDFGRFLTPDDRLSYPRLLWHVARSPSIISKLMQFQRSLGIAAGRLAAVLGSTLVSPHS